MRDYFGVSVIHGTLIWATGCLTCVRDLFCRRINTGGTSVYGLVRNFRRVGTEFDSREISGRAQSLAHNCHHPAVQNAFKVIDSFFHVSVAKVVSLMLESPIEANIEEKTNICTDRRHPRTSESHKLFKNFLFTHQDTSISALTMGGEETGKSRSSVLLFSAACR